MAGAGITDSRNSGPGLGRSVGRGPGTGARRVGFTGSGLECRGNTRALPGWRERRYCSLADHE